MKRCDWCGQTEAEHDRTTVYWELPDGTKAVEITETPAVSCGSCGMVYQEESIIQDIENQLLLIDTKALPSSVSFDTLMKTERILKRNYFDFSS
ncbi:MULTISPECIES: YokU family protein [Bacillus]|uniref:YokU family protein n=1 Tax=Bacillus TaxID=1386 RepID=UPI000421F621|nr:MULTISPECIES: YokU family protein [Bacillus]QHZ47318.1 YokU family protein [Bacillus sp. NSP9.1]WFA03378.1 YokU family protein [Bacillus sp. HSf4]